METPSACRFRTLVLLAVLCVLMVHAAGRLTGPRPEELATDAAQDARCRLRHWLADASGRPTGRLPGIPEDLCLVGIDDQTLLRFGKFGSGAWAVREPFCQLLPVLDLHRPSAVGFDILFRPAAEQGAAAGTAETAPTPESVRQAVGRLLEPAGGAPAARDLAELTRFAANQAEANLADGFLYLAHPPPGKPEPGIPVVCAFDLRWPEPGAGVAPFSAADIVGNAPGAKSEKDGDTIPYLQELAIPAPNVRNIPDGYRYAVNATLPSKSIRDAVQHGFINVPRDSDGIIRRIPLVLGVTWKNPATGRVRHEFLPSLPLLCVMAHWGLKPADVQVAFGDAVILNRRPPLRELRIPVDGQGRLYLNYAGRAADYPNVSMLHLLAAGRHELAAREGRITLTPEQKSVCRNMAAMIRKRICLVGLTATGSTDIGPCPVDANTPYVHIHLTAAGNILSGRFLRPPGEALTLSVLGVLALVSLLLFRQGGVLRLAVVTAGVLLGYEALAFYLLWTDAALLPFTAPVLLMVLLFLGVFVLRHRLEIQGRKRVRAMFSTMVSPEVLRFMEEHPESFSVAGTRAEATIQFSDIAGFTAISEQQSPEQVTVMLNEYFDAMAGIIMAEGGYVDKFEGDAIMAAWGVPYAAAGHAAAACRAALRQRDAVARLRPEFRSRFGIDLAVRFGLNSGSVIAGNMGSRRRFQYTVMGDAVNQAARLEPANKDYGTSILIGETTRAQIGEAFVTRLLDKVVLAGKTRPACIYELIAEAGADLPRERREFISLYEEALLQHWKKNWGAAEARLRKALELMPEEPSAKELLRRIAAFRAVPPPEGWHGEHVRAGKD